MTRTMKTAIALLCTLTMLVPTCAFALTDGTKPSGDKTPPGGDSDGTTTVTYDYIEFGSYPQTEVVSKAEDSGVYGKNWAAESDYIVNESLYSTLQNLADNEWDANGDATVDGSKYRRIKKSDVTYSKSADSKSEDSESSDGKPTESDTVDMYYNWASDNTYHYFKYEPIKWRILKQDGDDYFLLSEIVLDDQQYNTKLDGSITWENSTIRSWLNGYDSSKNAYGTDYSSRNFLDTAFSSEEQARIKTTSVTNKNNTAEIIVSGRNTSDKIYLLSDDDASASDYGFSSSSNKENTARQAKSSTYAKAMGAKSNDSGNCYWWLRSAGSHCGLAVLVRSSGSVYEGGQHANSKSRGVRPAMHVVLSADDPYRSTAGHFQIVFDSQAADVTYGIGEADPAAATSQTVVEIGKDKALTVCVTPKTDAAETFGGFYGFRVVTHGDNAEDDKAAVYTVKDEEVSFAENTSTYSITLNRSGDTALTVELLWNGKLSYTISCSDSAEHGQLIVERIRLNGVTYSIYESEYSESGEDAVYPMSAITGGSSDITSGSYAAENDDLLNYGLSVDDQGNVIVLRYVKGVEIDCGFIPDDGYEAEDLACVVLVSNDGGKTYERLTAAKDGESYAFTATSVTGDTVIKAVRKGDLDGDGEISEEEIRKVRQSKVGSETLSALEFAVADLDGDGEVSVTELVQIRLSAAGKYSIAW